MRLSRTILGDSRQPVRFERSRPTVGRSAECGMRHMKANAMMLMTSDAA